MTITKRLVKGSPVTAAEYDGTLDDLLAQIAAKAALASPALSGTPTAPTAAAGVNTTQIATTAFVAAAIANLIASAPGALDTLNELAAALGDDPNFAATVTNALALKAPLASPALIGNPTAPTQTAGNSTTRIATTAFVAEAVAGVSGGGSTGEELIRQVHNATGAALTKFKAVGLAGFDATSGFATVQLADGTGAMPAIGVVRADIADGAEGYILRDGRLQGLDTSGFTLGDALFVGASGSLTKVKPLTGRVQQVAIVTRIDAANGEVFVAIEPDGILIDSLTIKTALDGSERLPIGGDEAITSLQIASLARGVDMSIDASATRQFTATDHGKLIGASTGAAVYTIPADTSENLALGWTVNVLRCGATSLTIQAEDGTVTVNGTTGGSVTVQSDYKGVATIFRDPNGAYIVVGDVA